MQPLVENAIKHGIARARSGGTVSVCARLDRSGPGTSLHVVVRNTGAPLSGRESQDGGVGLRSVERRLEFYYGKAASLTLQHAADGATAAELTLPAGDIEDANAAAFTKVRRA